MIILALSKCLFKIQVIYICQELYRVSKANVIKSYYQSWWIRETNSVDKERLDIAS